MLTDWFPRNNFIIYQLKKRIDTFFTLIQKQAVMGQIKSFNVIIIINYANFSIGLLIFIKNNQNKQMDEQLRKLLLIGGLIGASYYAYNRYSKQTLGLKQTRKILQEIKHQILIVTINYCEGTRETLVKIRATNPDKVQQAFDFFRGKVVDIYNQKQQLILGKHDIPKEKFAESLQYYKNDSKIKAAQDQIIDMLDKTVRGQTPNLDVDARVTKAFSKERIVQIYQDMSKMILETIIVKFQNEEKINSNFDSNNEAHFKKAIKELNIYDKKVEFFKTKGFNEQWGCPNENFFKLSESIKLKDPEFKEQMKRLEKIYEEIVDLVTKNPSAVQISKLDAFYIRVPEPSRDSIHKKNTENRFVNLNSSTKSDGDQHEEVPVFTKIENKTLVPQKNQVQNQQINVAIEDDLPSDAHELQKQTHSAQQQIEIKENVQKKQQNIQKGQSKDSNVSVDGDSAQPVKQESGNLNHTEENKEEENKEGENKKEENKEEENKLVSDKLEHQEQVPQVEQKVVEQQKVEEEKVKQEKIEQKQVQQEKKTEEVHEDQATQKEPVQQKVPDQVIDQAEQVHKVEQNQIQPTEQKKTQEVQKQSETQPITQN